MKIYSVTYDTEEGPFIVSFQAKDVQHAIKRLQRETKCQLKSITRVQVCND